MRKKHERVLVPYHEIIRPLFSQLANYSAVKKLIKLARLHLGAGFTACVLIALVVISRITPHLPNVTPLAGITLFSSKYQPKFYAFIVSLIALFLSDVFLGFHNTMLFVYASFVLNSFIGLALKRLDFLQYVLVASITSAFQFFIITNLGVFIATSIYEKNLHGLIECYIAALPFFRNSLFGDLFYTGVLCSFYELCRTILKPSVIWFSHCYDIKKEIIKIKS